MIFHANKRSRCSRSASIRPRSIPRKGQQKVAKLSNASRIQDAKTALNQPLADDLVGKIRALFFAVLVPIHHVDLGFLDVGLITDADICPSTGIFVESLKGPWIEVSVRKGVQVAARHHQQSRESLG